MIYEFNLKCVTNRIKSICRISNITVKDMLVRCGLSEKVVDNMSRGSYPSIDKIAKIAYFFNLSIDELLFEQPNDNLIFEKLKSPNNFSDVNIGPVPADALFKDYCEHRDFYKKRDIILDKLRYVRQSKEYDLIEYLNKLGLDINCYARLKEFKELSMNEVEILSKDLNIDKSEFFKWYKITGYPDKRISMEDYENSVKRNQTDTMLSSKEKNTNSGLTGMETEVLKIFNKLTTKDQLKFIGRMEQQYEEYVTPPMAFAARSADPENTNCRPQIDPAKLEALDNIPTMDEE